VLSYGIFKQPSRNYGDQRTIQEIGAVVPHIKSRSRHRSHQAKCWDVLWDKEEILLGHEDLEKGATIITKYYVVLLDKL
jgi:hypothetical protein